MFSKKAEYALRATIYIAQKASEEKKIGLREIANAIDSPKSFTAKILQILTGNKKIVSSMHGPNGGFFITEKAKKLPVRAVLEAVHEDSVLTKCILGLKECSEINPCPMHAEYKAIRARLTELFEKKTIKKLADEISKGKLSINNRKIRSPIKKSPNYGRQNEAKHSENSCNQ
ncbi:MAG: RrF2 family transcriptional regulator [Chitinophagales bacterium]